MVSETSAGAPPTVRERYGIGYREAHLALFRQRTLTMCAPFLLPHLRPGLTVLDVGCGPGSLTVELAERVAPGQVVGVDIAAGQFAGARALAAERGVGTVRFEAGDAYALPFPDASIDVVFSHALISHLGEPQRALAEMRRVLKPGGLAAISENDTGAFAIVPAGAGAQRRALPGAAASAGGAD